MLEQLRRRHPVWAGFDRAALLDSRECVQTISSELELGPVTDVASGTRIGRGVFDQMFTPYIQALVATSLIQYEVVKVQVLDARSGAPIRNARVKSVAVRIGTRVITTTFAHDSQMVPQSPTIGLQSQKALAGLGYSPGAPTANYGDLGRQKYKEYWDARIPGAVDAVTSGNPPEYMLRLIIAEYNSHRATDSNGILKVRLPTSLFDNQPVGVDVGFWEFPIVLEATSANAAGLRRHEAGGGGPAEGLTRFTVSWIGPQNTVFDQNVDGTGDFGWQLSDGEHSAMLKVGERLRLKENTLPFTGLTVAALSPYFSQTGMHFVLFGLQWCQPVWDSLVDSTPAGAGAFTHTTYIPTVAAAGLHMHLVSVPFKIGGSEQFGNKGYGKAENSATPKWRGCDSDGCGHLGLDIYAKVGDDIFAVHGGEANPTALSGNAGNKIRLEWTGTAFNVIEYLHLSAFVVSDPERVLAGTLIGKTGRTGNLGEVSPWPSHVHLNVGTPGGEDIALRQAPDEANRDTIPHNDIPLVFPCACEVTSNSPAMCRFTSPAFVSTCWAPAELRCPYMREGSTELRLQAQLRYLHDAVNTELYADPGPLDGDLGAVPTSLAVSLPEGTPIERLAGDANTKHGGKLIKINDGTTSGWIESSLVDDDDKIHIPGGGSLNSLASIPVGSTRMAIYLFRKARGLLSYAGYAANFTMDAPAQADLNTLAPVATPS
jgi:murein DD-endopeptidase MepM/ murein hydrolase activator NlpD